MGLVLWGGLNGEGGDVVLMNMFGINSCVIVQMVVKVLLKVMFDLLVDVLYDRVVVGDFDIGCNLVEYLIVKFEGKCIVILGYGNIGCELVWIVCVFYMDVVIYVCFVYCDNILVEGYYYVEILVVVVLGVDVLLVYLGLGCQDVMIGIYVNVGLIDVQVLLVLNDGVVLLNYDWGELVWIDVLDGVLVLGKLCYVVIDVDMFMVEGQVGGQVIGLMVFYLLLLF